MEKTIAEATKRQLMEVVNDVLAEMGVIEIRELWFLLSFSGEDISYDKFMEHLDRWQEAGEEYGWYS